jgi:hypothetical protein
MPAPVIAAAGKVVSKVTAKAIAKKIVASAGKAAVGSVAHDMKGSMKKTYIIAAAVLAFPPLCILAFTILMSSIPMALAQGQKVDDTKKAIAQYVKLQDEVENYAQGVADKKADAIEATLRELEPMPAPSPTSDSANATPTATPAQVQYIYKREINVSSPPWRVLMALDSVHSGQDYKKLDIDFIKQFVIKHLSYETDYDTVKAEGSITITIYIDTSCSSIIDMAAEISSLNTELEMQDKEGIADGTYDFLTYYDDDGTLQSTPYYDLGADIGVDDPFDSSPGCVPLPYFNQGETRWNYKNGQKIIIYPPDRTIKTSGCGATSVAMVIVGLTGDRTVNPLTVMDYAIKYGYYKGNGIYASMFAALGKQYGISVSYWWPSGQRIADAIQNGHPVIAHMGAAGSAFPHGHFLVLKGITADGRVIINDPGSKANTGVTWSMYDIVSSAKGVFAECWVEEGSLLQ